MDWLPTGAHRRLSLVSAFGVIVRYLRNNGIVLAVFLAAGALTVFVPVPERFGGSLSLLILTAMLTSFFVASFLAFPDRLAASGLGVALSGLSAITFSAIVVTLMLMMVVAVYGCL